MIRCADKNMLITVEGRYYYLDPDIPNVGNNLDNITITVLRTGNEYSDEVSGTMELLTDGYRVKVYISDLPPSHLYTLQTKITSGKYVYYGKRKTVRIGRKL